MNRSFHLPLLAVALLAGSTTITAAAASGSALAASVPPTTAFTVMLNWTPNAHHLGIYVAEQRGWYDEAGLDVTIVEPGADGVATALASGHVDVGLTVAEGLLPARAAGIPIVSVATVLPHNDSSLIALADSGIARPRDLEGKRYGGYGGPLEVELISRLVECDGGDPDAVEFVEIGDVDYLAGMDQGAFDVAWVFSGWDGLRASVIEDRELAELRFADHLDCIPDWYTPLLAASESTIADEPELLAAFLDATSRGYAAAMEDPAAAADDLLAAASELDADLVHAAAEYYATRFTDGDDPWGRQDETVWSEFAAFATDAGLLDGDVDVDVAAAYTNDFVG